MAAESIPTTSGIETNSIQNKQEEIARHPTVEELLIQIENHLYKNIEHRASLLIAVWSCLAGKIGCFRNMEKIFHMLYRESAMTIFCGHWPKVNMLFKRGLSRALIHFSHSMGHFIKGAEGLCSALVMAAYDPWGDPVFHRLLSKDDLDQNSVDEFIKSEPFELLVIRVECLVNARFEEAAIRLCRCCLKSHLYRRNHEDDEDFKEKWRWTFLEWLLRLLFRKGRLNDLVAESGACSCHDGVRLIYRTRNSPLDDSEPLTETLINLFLVRDLLFQSNYCCTSELMSLWCDFQVHKQRSASEIQDAAQKLLVGHASSSAQFYLFVDILWGKFGTSLLPLYIEMYVRGLTSDLNYLEAARQADNKEYVIEIENHMAAMYFKLSSMFQNINKEIALECMLSSFSLDPTKERLDWIKKLSLQISKDKAIQLAAAKNDACKHKQCNKIGCVYPHSITPKKKSVVMCDQAIQVGDDSFETETVQHVSYNCNSSCGDDISSSGVKENSSNELVNDQTDQSDLHNFKEKDEQICSSSVCENAIESKIVAESSPDKNSLNENKKKINADLSNELITSEVKEIDSVEIKKDHMNNIDSNNFESNCKSESPEKNYIPHNGEIYETSKKSAETELPYCKNSKIDDLKSQSEMKSENDSSKNYVNHNCEESNAEIIASNHTIHENGFISNSETENSLSSLSSKSKTKEVEHNGSDTSKNNHDEQLSNSVHVNGCDEAKDSSLSDETNIDEVKNEFQKSSNTPNDEKDFKSYDKSDNNISDSVECIKDSCVGDKQNNSDSVIDTVNSDTEKVLKDENMENNISEQPFIDENEIKSKLPFTHTVLDSQISGLSNDLLSDFVIVLESLRNKQLKSSCKWSQIKHLCENYLENVTNSRCMMLNMQTNESIDSEDDSVSEFTAGRLKGFESHQSDDSIVEDHYVDKSHVLKRFMHTDKNAEMATYVNLSDIHCPQIPLEKLFYTDYSSSHLVHKKRHKKHRNHDKNPEKVVLKKLRHSSRAEHDLVKRKKRKKRKGKRTKNHLKKHHFIHGKTNKDYLKNKKKKHKLKKKKEERNSGFISGDYCSDFSSAELMRLVKEHSHSYSKLPATTSKRPHSICSSSDEPTRKKRKVTFDKKKQKPGKYHDKHKHQKSKSSKRKKKLSAIDSCQANVKNITDHTLHGKLDAVNDYSRIVQYSKVKKMKTVQIRQRSVALNLSEVSKVHQEQENPATLVNPCASGSQLQQLVQQNFESSEDIMKMQLLMAQAQQQPDVMPISSNNNFLSSANNQAVLKYVCSKMTSHLLSVAQSNCTSSDEGSKTATPTYSGKTYQTHNTKFQPLKTASNVKHVFIERSGVPYKITTSSSSPLAGTIIPVSCLSSATTTDSKNLMGTVFTGGITYPATASSPQVTTFTIPVAHNSSGGAKLVASKIVIPVNQCSNLRTATPTPIALPETDSRSLASTSSSPPISGVIIVKNGNNTQIISNVQQPSAVLPCFPTARVTVPQNRSKPSPIVTKTVPKMIKQAAKKLMQPVARKPIFKTVIGPKPLTSSNSEGLNDPLVASSLLTCKEKDIVKPDISSTSLNVSSENTSNASILVEDLSVNKEFDSSKVDSGPANEPTVSSSSRDISLLQKDNNISLNETNTTSSIEDKNELCAPSVVSPKPDIHVSPVKDLLHDTPEQPSVPLSPKDDDVDNSAKQIQEDNSVSKGDSEISEEKVMKETEPEEEEEYSVTPKATEIVSPNETQEESPAVTDKEKETTPEHIVDEKDDNIKSPFSLEKPDIPKDDNEDTINNQVSVNIEENKSISPTNESVNVSLKLISAQSSDNSHIKPVNLTSGDQGKQLQPINDGETSSGKSSPKVSSLNKSEGGSQTSEAPTRSFTSISDAVRFSLMDMDDATDSVENQVVLQAFQTSRASSPASPTYAASESGEEHNSASPSSAVMLSAPQSTSTTELNVSRVTQRFEQTVHCSQSEKFTECPSTVSRAATWILEDTITEQSPAVTVQKSPDIDSCGEGKDDDKPKKKRKKKERVDNDVTHKFWCQICSKGFFSAYNLRRHCRNVHKMVLPKGSSDVPFSNSSQCLPHIQQADTATSETSSSRLSYGNVQTSCVSPNKGSEYSLLSPSHENKNQEFSVKSGQHVSQIQSAEFQMQTPPRMSSQSSSTHISPVTPPKDFRHGTPTSVSTPQISPNKISPVKSPSQSKFQRLPTGTQVPQMTKISQMQQIALCGQQALQQQRQLGQMQSPGLIQPLPSVACQAQQIQASQCPHFQANKQIVQQRIGQLQLMHHVSQLPSVPHATHGIQKPTQSQSFKKCSNNQSPSKISENEQMQQAAQLAQNQQLLANQQMQKLIQIRQNAIAASGIASQLSLANAIPSVSGSPVKGTAQCFQSQLAAARQAAVVGQIPTAQRAQGSGYNLSSHDASSHQFFSPAVQSGQDQTSCPHSSFSAQNMSEFNANAPSYPTIRLSSEANDGLEDLEQFLLENMPWSGEQASTHGLSQQSGNRPSSADSLTLSIPTQTSNTSQNRGGVASKGKASISRPKPRKPVATPCSKNLLGNLGRGVKKKSCSKKTSKSSDTECAVAKPDVFSQTNLIQPSHELKQCNKDTIGNLPNFSKQTVKSSAVGILNETDSSDSVQCINVTHNNPPKNASVGINFNIFSPVGLCTSEKNTELMCTPSSCKETYDGQRKNSFLDHSNLVATNSSNLDQNKSSVNINQCEATNPINMGSAFNPTGKNSASTMKPFCPTGTTPYGITNETPNPQDIFLGQRNSETSDSNNSNQKNIITAPDSFVSNSSTSVNVNNTVNTQTSVTDKSPYEKNLFLGGSSKSSDEKSEPTVNGVITEQKDSSGGTKHSVSDESDNVNNSASEECTSFNSEINSILKTGHEVSTSSNISTQNASNPEKTISCDKNPCSDNVGVTKEDEPKPKNQNLDNVCENKDYNPKPSVNECITNEAVSPIENNIKDLSGVSQVSISPVNKDRENHTKDLPAESETPSSPVNETSENHTKDPPAAPETSSSPVNEERDEIQTETSLISVDHSKTFSSKSKNNNSAVNESKKETETAMLSEKLELPQNDVESETSNSLLKKNSQEKESEISNVSLKRNVGDKCLLPKVINHDENSNHEDAVSNDENHLPKKIEQENIGNEIGLNRIALRVRKSQDASNKLTENDKNVPFFVADKDDFKSSVTKKNTKKKKIKQENRKNENKINDTKIPFKSENDSKIQKTRLLNSMNKEKDLNRSLCMITTCYEDIKNNNSVDSEGHDDGFCIDEKQLEESGIDGIPAARLRLRDTPKTSVKRVCPCCVDAKMPKKCRANGGGPITKIIGPKVSNGLKTKSTLKTRNTTNGHNGKINTRSSQRLRSRNNAIS